MNSLKVTITGPESSGKTTLSQSLANHYQTIASQEYARIYLNQLGNKPYTHEDLLEIAHTQIIEWKRVEAIHQKIYIKDTDLTVFKIWEMDKFGTETKWLENLWRAEKTDVLFLCKPDIPWQPDPLRENAYDRDRLFSLYIQLLEKKGYPYYILYGNQEKRFEKAIYWINRMINLP